MLLCNFLHFYQPFNQQEDILHRIVQESYLPIIKGLKERPEARLVFNISGVLLKLLRDRGYDEVLQGLNELFERDQIELTASAMYHAFLPLLPENEIKRQIMLNTEECLKCFGDKYQPVGFFSPEMAVNDRVLKVISEMGFEWVAAPQVAYGAKEMVPDKLFKDKKSGIFVFFRNKRVSVLILSAVARSAKGLLEETQDIIDRHKYWFTVMDGETFGHHRIGHEKMLFEILDDSHFKSATAKDILSLSQFDIEEFSLRPSTWTNEEQDFWLDKEQTQKTEAKSFILWQDPENPIHRLQWSFTDFVLKNMYACIDADLTSMGDTPSGDREGKLKKIYAENPGWKKARVVLDEALASDPFWWASTKPWWSLEMVEQGAFLLREVIRTLTDDESINAKAEDFYRKILDQAFEWQRTGYIRKRHLEDSATFMNKPFSERTPAEWYNQIVLEFEDEMNRAAKNREFEKAIKWRDALLKLKQGTDMYDVLHVVNELWSARKIPEVKPFLTHEWEEFSAFAKENFKDVTSKEEFERWQKAKDSKTGFSTEPS